MVQERSSSISRDPERAEGFRSGSVPGSWSQVSEVSRARYLILWSFLVAKKSMIEREKKRLSLAHKFFQKRNEFKKQMSLTKSFKEQLFFSVKLQKLPKNSSITRLHNRCFVTGRPKGYFRDFGISRHVLREMAHQCLLPGITKASW